MEKCTCCGEKKADVRLHRTVAQIKHGGFPVKRELRCTSCNEGIWRILEKQRDALG